MTRIHWFDTFNILFGALNKGMFDVEALAPANDSWKDFFCISVKDGTMESKYILLVKPLTLSSRDRVGELNYQIVQGPRDNLLAAAKKYDAAPLYVGWHQETNAFLVPAPAKVRAAPNQNSIYWRPKEWLDLHADELPGKVAVRLQGEEFSHLFLVSDFPRYLISLCRGLFDKDTGKPSKDESNLDGVGTIALPTLPGESTDGSSAEMPQQAARSPRAAEAVDRAPVSIMFCGPPGTGKTRAAVVLADLLLRGDAIPSDLASLQTRNYPEALTEETNRNFFRTQFHPSYAYEDFLEGLRPIERNEQGEGKVSYRVIPGILKIVANLARARIQPGVHGITFSARYEGDKTWRLNDSVEMQLYQFSMRSGEIRHGSMAIQYTGNRSKSPYTIPDDAHPLKPGHYPVTWYSDGEGDVDFVLVIDEFNRGNAARIFGEALSLIEQSKRLAAEEEAALVLPYSHDRLVLPQNLHIICAMNLADRSLTALDQALRRRFRFIYLKPKFDLVQFDQYKFRGTHPRDVTHFTGIHADIIKHFDAINSALKSAGISEDRHIGHSYAFKLLGEFYRALEKQPGSDAVLVARLALSKLWDEELHPLIRDILGDHRIAKFQDALCNEIESDGAKPISRLTDIENLKKYLDSPFPDASICPWKAA